MVEVEAHPSGARNDNIIVPSPSWVEVRGESSVQRLLGLGSSPSTHEENPQSRRRRHYYPRPPRHPDSCSFPHVRLCCLASGSHAAISCGCLHYHPSQFIPVVSKLDFILKWYRLRNACIDYCSPCSRISSCSFACYCYVAKPSHVNGVSSCQVGGNNTS